MTTIKDEARRLMDIDYPERKYTCDLSDWDEAYNAARRPYFEKGFKAGVKFSQSDIPVEVEFPKSNDDGESDLILMKVGNSYYTGNYINGDWVGNDPNNSHYDPTHWRPINYK